MGRRTKPKGAKPAPKPAPKPRNAPPTPAVSSTALKNNENLAEFAETIARNNRKAAAAAKGLTDISEELTGVWTSFADVVQDAARYMDTVKDPTKEISDNFSAIQKAAKDIYANLEDIGDQYYEQVDLTQQIAKAREDSEKAQKLGLEDAKKTLDIQVEQLQALEKSAGMMNKAHEIAVKKGISIREITQDIVQPMKDLMSSVSQFPGGGFLTKVLGVDGKLEKIQKQVMTSFVKNLDETGSVGKSAFKALGTGAGSFIKSLGPALLVLGSIAAAIGLVKLALDMDKEVTELARGFGLSKHEAHELHTEFKGILATTNIVGASNEELVNSFKELTDLTGQNVVANKDLLETQILLKKQYGLTGEEAAQFQQMSMGINQNSEQVLQTIKSTVEDFNKLTNSGVNYKKITQDIAKASKATLANYKGSIPALAAAAAQARNIGLTFEELNSMSSTLLDFEASIGKEMAANVLTGKSMNLNRARELAFAGDIVGAGEEALKQAGSLDEFLKMERYQRDAIAAATGLTVDQIIEAGELQKVRVALGGKEVKDLSELNAEEREKLLNQGIINKEKAKELEQAEQIRSTQEQFALIVENIKNTFIEIAAGPLGAMVSSIGSLLQNTAALKGILAAVAIILASMAISAIATASASTLGLAAFAIAAGIGVAVASMDSATNKAKSKATSLNDAEIAPDGGLVVSGKKGTYKLHQDDTIIAGTGLSSNSMSNSTAAAPASSGMTSMAKVEKLLQELISKVDQPVKIQLGTKVLDEIEKQTSIRKTYATSVDKGYGAFG